MEFGSDFHYIDNFRGENEFSRRCSGVRLYASGRHALEAIYKKEKWKRIWIPDYFCYEVVHYLQKAGLKIVFYPDNPLMDKVDYSDIDFQGGDALLRVNYFGLKAKRCNLDIPVPVVEDHTHDLIGQWALNSDADWCISSLRKTLPFALGGFIWSPKNHILPEAIEPSEKCLDVAKERYEAMKMKAKFLECGGNKSLFREKFIKTETELDVLPLSGIDPDTHNLLNDFDVRIWTEIKKKNWRKVKERIGEKIIILPCEDSSEIHPFSVVFLMKDNDERENFRRYLIENSIYPAILWSIPRTASAMSIDFGNRMLSMHCDARYNSDAIVKMCEIINRYD